MHPKLLKLNLSGIKDLPGLTRMLESAGSKLSNPFKIAIKFKHLYFAGLK